MNGKPNKVTIGGKVITIVYSAENCSGDDYYGWFDSANMRIFINPKESLNIQESTLFHECLHAALFISGTKHLLKGKEEETVVRSLESMLHGLFVRNKKKFKNKKEG